MTDRQAKSYEAPSIENRAPIDLPLIGGLVSTPPK
jgi:hypothetical protein